MRATAIASPLERDLFVKAAYGEGLLNKTKAVAAAERRVGILCEMSTICALPDGVRCERRVGSFCLSRVGLTRINDGMEMDESALGGDVALG